MSPKEALSLIKTGDHIFIGSACGEPQYLVKGLVEKADLADNEILHVHTLGVAPYTKPIYSERFRLNAFLAGSTLGRLWLREGLTTPRSSYPNFHDS